MNREPTLTVPEDELETRPAGSLAEPAAEQFDNPDHEYDADVAEPKEAKLLQEVREDMGITELIDPLRALLEAPVGPVMGSWKCHRLKTEFKIRALTVREYNQIQDRATRFTRNKRTGRNERDIDPTTMSLLVCSVASMNPNFAAPVLAKKYKDRQPHEIVGQVLLPGEVDKLAEAILNLSGYEDDLEESGKD